LRSLDKSTHRNRPEQKALFRRRFAANHR